MYQYCQYKRLAEKEGMTRAMKEARLDRARELRRQKKEEEDAQKFADLNSGNVTPGAGAAESKSSSWKLW
jgi:cytochrome c oxidase assembly protein subunit 20